MFANTFVTLTFVLCIFLQIFMALMNSYSFLIIVMLIFDGALVIPAMAFCNYIEEKLYYRSYSLVILIKITTFIVIIPIAYTLTYFIRHLIYAN